MDNALAAGLISSDKLKKLPRAVQDALSELTIQQLGVLQSAVCKHDHFDFLGLPIEIRTMVYELLLSTSSGQITKYSPSVKGRDLLPDMGLFRVCKFVSKEAMETFARLNTVKFKFHSDQRGVVAPLRDAICHLRTIELTFTPMRWYISETSCSHKYAHALLQHLIKAYTKLQPPGQKRPVQLTVNFVPAECSRLFLGADIDLSRPENQHLALLPQRRWPNAYVADANQTALLHPDIDLATQFYLTAGFLRAQLKWVVREAEERACVENTGLVIKSNIDVWEKGWHFEKLNEVSVFFRDFQNHRQGFVELKRGAQFHATQHYLSIKLIPWPSDYRLIEGFAEDFVPW